MHGRRQQRQITMNLKSKDIMDLLRKCSGGKERDNENERI